ncbi:iron-containing redox enzyme family protein [Streptomyces mirabilis]|uniref:iron-containing redox enzyme family protein n=1 Tax=Streptomyces mirabilis TaxID=68239 RepID=UPI0037A5917F
MAAHREARLDSPPLPSPRGTLSAAVISALRQGTAPPLQETGGADPYGEDLQLALYLLYELHYQGFHGVDDDREWDPDLLTLRRALERRFLAALRTDVPGPVPLQQALDELLTEPVGDPVTSVRHYLDAAPAEALATVNLMSLLGLPRALRGALVGHFATVEVTSSPGSRRLAKAMRRADAGPAAARFYDEPGLEPDIVFGIQATVLLEDRLGTEVLRAWHAGRSALRTPAGAPGPGVPCSVMSVVQGRRRRAAVHPVPESSMSVTVGL